MKFIILSFIIALFSFQSIGQTITDIIGSSKMDYIGAKLDLNAEQLAQFKSIYATYEEKRNKVVSKKKGELQNMMQSFSDVDFDLTQISKTINSYNSKEMSELEKCYKSMVSTLGKRTADKFVLTEKYLISLESLMQMEKIPLLEPGFIQAGNSSPETNKSEDNSEDEDEDEDED
jgi:hypothetical protein